MKIGIAGAGAVGCHYGSLLQQAGSEIVMLARGAHLAALQAAGLLHESGGAQKRVPVIATDDVSRLADCDVVLVSCKMAAMEDMLALLHGHVRSDALLVTLQNGVQAPGLLASAFPQHAVLAGTAFIGARIEHPGHVIHSAAGGIRLAAWQHGPGSLLVEHLLKALEDAQVPARMEPDAKLMLWRKLLWNIGFNAITAITRRYAKDVAAKPETLAIIRAAMLETVDLANAEDVALTGEDIAKHIRVTLEMGPVKTSMWQDIEAGRLTEVDYINGFIAEQSTKNGMDAPVNRILTALLHAIEGI